MNPMEYAAGDELLHGRNPLQMRGLFPSHWGDAPAGPEALRCWIESNALRDGASKGHPSAIQVLLERRREDPSAVREKARIATVNRLRREELMRRFLNRP